MRYIVRSVDGAEYGPFTRDELQQLVRERRLGPGDFVRRESGRTWSPFDQIAGLSDLAIEDTSAPLDTDLRDRARPAADRSSGAPTRPRLEPQPERIDSSTPRSPRDSEASIPIVSEPLASPEGSEWASSTAASPYSDHLVTPADPATSLNPFVAGGLPIDLLDDEDTQFVLVQSFLDAFRDSAIGALLGHRARLICTDRRAVVLRPGLGSSAMTIAWLDRAGYAGIEAKLSILRLVFGIVCLVYAAFALVTSTAGNGVLSALSGGNAGSGAALIGVVIATVASLLGMLSLATSRARVVAVGDGLQFPCAAASSWHLARIDAGRMRSVDA